MWTTNKWLIAASYLLILPLQTAATVFTYGKDANCSYPVTIVVNNVTCNGNEYCQFGNTMDISGRIDLQANLPSSEMLVTTDVCFMGMKYFCKTYNTSLNVCNALGVTDYNDGTPCPNAGSFYFTSHVNIPGYSGFSFGSGWYAGVTIKVADPNPYKNIGFQCTTSFNAQSDNSSNYSSTSMISGAALIGVLVVLFATRKRRVATIDLAQEEQRAGESTSGFEMMSDSAVRV